MPLIIDRCLKVSLDTGGKVKTVTLDSDMYSELDGKVFVKLAKYRSCTATLLDGYGHGEQSETRPLSRTDVIEQIVNLRNGKWKELHKRFERPAEVAVNFDCNDPKQKTLSAFHWRVVRKDVAVNHTEEMPTTVWIHMPAFCDIEGIDMEVCLEDLKHGAPLIELKEENIVYLRRIVAAQIEAGSVKRKHPSPTVAPDDKIDTHEKGSSFSYSRGKFLRMTAAGTRHWIDKKDYKTDAPSDPVDAVLEVVEDEL